MSIFQIFFTQQFKLLIIVFHLKIVRILMRIVNHKQTANTYHYGMLANRLNTNYERWVINFSNYLDFHTDKKYLIIFRTRKPNFYFFIASFFIPLFFTLSLITLQV